MMKKCAFVCIGEILNTDVSGFVAHIFKEFQMKKQMFSGLGALGTRRWVNALIQRGNGWTRGKQLSMKGGLILQIRA